MAPRVPGLACPGLAGVSRAGMPHTVVTTQAQPGASSQGPSPALCSQGASRGGSPELQGTGALS